MPPPLGFVVSTGDYVLEDVGITFAIEILVCSVISSNVASFDTILG